MKRHDDAMRDLAQWTLQRALAGGAEEAAVRLSRAEFVDEKRRDGRTESLEASQSRSLSLALFAGERYSENSTNFVDEAALEAFVERCLELTRVLTPDPLRALPDPALYGPAEAGDLELTDPGYEALDNARREAMVQEVEEAALEADPAVISATAGITLRRGHAVQLHSNGFAGESEGTAFYLGASVTARDDDDRRPEDYYWTAARHLAELPRPAFIGAEAARRALARRGGRKVQSGRMTMVLENRAALRLVASLLEPLHGSVLQQRRSCFEEALDRPIAAPTLTLTDQPLLARGLGSRTYDGDGLRARELPVVQAGTLRNYFLDVYYGRKLSRPPTTGGPSNLVLAPGERPLAQMLSDVERGVLVTAFLGGNANPATGDFSFGVSGVYLEDGQPVHPVSEMNITGSHLRLWQRLAEVGDDPYRFSSWRVPSLRFDEVQFSGL